MVECRNAQIRELKFGFGQRKFKIFFAAIFGFRFGRIGLLCMLVAGRHILLSRNLFNTAADNRHKEKCAKNNRNSDVS